MTNLVSGETMNKAYDIFRGMTRDQIIRFQVEVSMNDTIPEPYALLMMYQARVAISRGWYING